MKKSLSVAALILAAVCITGCKTTEVKGSGIKGKPAKMAQNYVTLLDYQGASFGTEIPQWVMAVGEGNYSPEALSKVMPGVSGKKIFVTIGRGDNLSFVQQWTDLVDIEVQVGDQMQRVVGKAVSAAQKGRSTQEGYTADATILEQELNMYKEAISAVELNGLEKIASYWIQKEVKKNKRSADSVVTYEYYAVWGMDEKLYNKQIYTAITSVDDNTDEGAELKALLSKKLQSMMLFSNDDELNDEFDDYLD